VKAIDDFYTHEGKQQNGLSGNNMKDFFRNTLSNLEKIKKEPQQPTISKNNQIIKENDKLKSTKE
jgi:hypothetical protein